MTGEKIGESGITTQTATVLDAKDSTLSEGQLDNLQWAKEFMDAYERKRSLLNERKHKNTRIRK